LVTVASAIHWFDLDKFYAEVRRVVKPGGVLAAWTYYTPVFGNDVDAIIRRPAHDVLADYWDERLHYAVDEFRDLPFPFEPIDTPRFRTDMRWNMGDLLGYFETWSSSVKYREANHDERPTKRIEDDLARAWGDPSRKPRPALPTLHASGAGVTPTNHVVSGVTDPGAAALVAAWGPVHLAVAFWPRDAEFSTRRDGRP
jgi:SAM-dependent methyltransferase